MKDMVSLHQRASTPVWLHTLLDVLRDSPRWLLLGLLVLGPWAFGSTRPPTKDWLVAGMLCLGPLLCLSLVMRRRWLRIGRVPFVLSMFILLYGWALTLNSNHVFYPWDFTPATGTTGFLSYLPASVDRAASVAQMLMITGLFFAFWIVADLSGNPRWRALLWITIGAVGLSIVILGLAQHATGAKAIFWQWGKNSGNFFATYRYHANAGAFINLVLPFLIWRSYLGIRRRDRLHSWLPWVLASVVIFASGFIHISRAASILTVVVTGMSLAAIAIDALFIRRLANRRFVILTIGFLFLFGSLIAWTFGPQKAIRKFVHRHLTDNSRLLTYQVITDYALPSSSLWGFGPGTFSMTFPFFADFYEGRVKGYWVYAHEDYLQTIMEWGWVGAGGWALFVFGGVIVGIWTVFRSSDESSEIRTLRMAALISCIGVLLHATVDFPLQIASLKLYATISLGLCWGLAFRPKSDL